MVPKSLGKPTPPNFPPSAEHIAERGIYVAPLRPKKKPTVKGNVTKLAPSQQSHAKHHVADPKEDNAMTDLDDMEMDNASDMADTADIMADDKADNKADNVTRATENLRKLAETNRCLAASARSVIAEGYRLLALSRMASGLEKAESLFQVGLALDASAGLAAEEAMKTLSLYP